MSQAIVFPTIYEYLSVIRGELQLSLRLLLIGFLFWIPVFFMCCCVWIPEKDLCLNSGGFPGIQSCNHRGRSRFVDSQWIPKSCVVRRRIILKICVGFFYFICDYIEHYYCPP